MFTVPYNHKELRYILNQDFSRFLHPPHSKVYSWVVCVTYGSNSYKNCIINKYEVHPILLFICLWIYMCSNLLQMKKIVWWWCKILYGRLWPAWNEVETWQTVCQRDCWSSHRCSIRIHLFSLHGNYRKLINISNNYQLSVRIVK